MAMCRVRGSLGVVSAVLITTIASPALAADVATTAPAAPDAVAAPALSTLEAFVDGVMATRMSAHRIAGVQVAVVKDGVPILIKGYGLASIEPQRAVDPQRSLFRVGSISKTFVWISLAQLANDKRLALTDPVNDYLPEDLRIPDEGIATPIRILDLMNHTAGFEDVGQNLFVAPDASPWSLHAQLRRFRPHRVREPGRFVAYSNYGAALAGAIVAHVAGEPFEDYVERRVFQPLGMEHTTFREPMHGASLVPSGLPGPMSPALAADRADGLEWQGGAWKAIPHEQIVQMAPAGAAVSTAADMARYMIALLDPAVMARAGILPPAAFESLRSESFRAAPGLAPVRHGFFEAAISGEHRFGYWNLSHSGATLHFHSHMIVIPELGLGLFVATNGTQGNALGQGLRELLVTRYFPRPAGALPALPEPAADFARRADGYSGRYRTTRRSYTGLEKLLTLIDVVQVGATADGHLVVQSGPTPGRYVESGKDVFHSVDGDHAIGFARDARGNVTHLLTIGGSAERIGVFETAGWLEATMVAALFASVGVLIAAALRGWRAWRRHADAQTAGERRSARLMVIVACGWVVSLVQIAVWGRRLGGDGALDELAFGYPQTSLKLGLTGFLLTALATVLALATLVAIWRRGTWSAGRRVRHTLVLAVWVVSLATAQQWNVLGWRYH